MAARFSRRQGRRIKPGGQIGGPLAGQAGRLGGDRRPRSDIHEGIQQLIVAGAAELLQERGASLARLVVQAVKELSDARGVLFRQHVRLRLEAVGEDVGVARGPGLGAQQAQPAAHLADRLRVQERGERSQVRPEPPGGNAELMDVFGILAEANPGVMTQDLGDRPGHRVTDQRIDGRIGPYRRHDDIGRPGGWLAKYPDHLGDGRFSPAAGRHEPADRRTHQAAADAPFGTDFDLDLAEASRLLSVFAVHGDPVVGDLS